MNQNMMIIMPGIANTAIMKNCVPKLYISAGTPNIVIPETLLETFPQDFESSSIDYDFPIVQVTFEKNEIAQPSQSGPPPLYLKSSQGRCRL